MPAEERTEAATPRRREQARRRGQVAKSAELTSAIVLVAAFVSLRVGGGYLYSRLSGLMTDAIGRAAQISPEPNEVYSYLVRTGLDTALTLAPVLGAVGIVGLLIATVQVGFVLSSEAMALNLARLNPVSGSSRMVSSRALVELIKSIAKVAIVGYVGYKAIAGEYENLFSIADMSIAAMVAYVGGLTFSLGIKTSLVLIVLGVVDYIFQRFEFEKSIRMTKEEIKQEAKEYDGDPLIRSRIRAKQREMSMSRMMQAVPKADVVVTNPTHYAVALGYEQGEMDAPVVLAKGKDLVAERIKDVAREHRIEIVENKPLAQALYKAVDVGAQIPVELYKAVAEVLAYVYRLEHRR